MANQSLTIAKTRLDGWRKRWDALHVARFGSDYELASLLHEIRYEFPRGPAGDLQFGVWMRKHFKGARNTKLLCAKAFAIDAFSEAEWTRFGGWQGVSFLTALSRADRARA